MIRNQHHQTATCHVYPGEKIIHLIFPSSTTIPNYWLTLLLFNFCPKLFHLVKIFVYHFIICIVFTKIILWILTLLSFFFVVFFDVLHLFWFNPEYTFTKIACILWNSLWWRFLMFEPPIFIEGTHTFIKVYTKWNFLWMLCFSVNH